MLSGKPMVVCGSAIPFLVAAVLYFWQYRVNQKPSERVVIFKVLPIYGLVFFVCVCSWVFKVEWRFWTFIALGLIASSAGDAYLVFNGPDSFLKGMISFAIAHILYISAYGFVPLKPLMGIITLLPGIGLLIVLVPRLTGVLKYGVPVYGLLLVTMVWRMLVTVSQQNGPLTPTTVLTAIGSVSWAISDSLLAYNEFHTPVKYAQVLVMITYYIGQFGVAVSIFNERHLIS